MKLGSETGSLVNHMFSRGVVGEPQPFVGMGVTFLSWTDRDAGTVVEVVLKPDGSVKRIGCTHDSATRVDSNGMSESQEYEFTSQPNGYRTWFAKDSKGFWVTVRENEKGNFVQARSGGLRIGSRDKYHDFSF